MGVSGLASGQGQELMRAVGLPVAGSERTEPEHGLDHGWNRCMIIQPVIDRVLRYQG